MNISGHDFLQSLLAQANFEAKCVFNENSIIFFPVSQQHRDTKGDGISYEDDYQGNALAAMISPGRLEVRYHRAFSEDRLRSIWDQLRAEPQLADLRDWKLFYQGKEIS